jgi:hypothetical protein
MKTTITTICVAIILYFSFSTAVNAVDVRQTCKEGLAENADLIFSQSEYNTLLNACVKKYSSYETKSTSPSTKKTKTESSVLGTIFKWIVIFVLGIFGFIVIAAFWPVKGSGEKNEFEFDSFDTPEKYDKFHKIKGGDFKDERKINRSAYADPVPVHPIDDEQFIGKEWAFDIFFQRSDLKFKKEDIITLANYYGAKYDEKDTIKVIQEKLYDSLESELSSGRFQNSYRVNVVTSFNYLGWHFNRLHKSGNAGKNADERASIFDNLMKYYEKIAQSSKEIRNQYHYEKDFSKKNKKK